MPTPSNLAGRLNRFCLAAQADGAAIAIRHHSVTAIAPRMSLVSWQCSEPPDLSNLPIDDVRTYLFCLENSHFSLVTQDGSLLQISFKIARGEIVGHRLSYVPCPVNFDELELIEDSLSDVVRRNLASADFSLVRHLGSLRFDFDPDAEGEQHPACHMTFNYDGVRVPVGRTFDAGTFVKFVDDNLVGSRAWMKRLNWALTFDGSRDVLAADQRTKPHFNWQTS
jgi:hypothetical protein